MYEWFSKAPVKTSGVVPDCEIETVTGPSLGIDIDNWCHTNMDYTDDITLFLPSSEDLRSFIRISSK